MADYVPFVNNDADFRLVQKFYSDAATIRVLLPTLRPTPDDPRLKRTSIWIDPGLDGYHCLLTDRRVFDSWSQYISQFEENDILADPDFVKKPSYAKIRRFIFSVLDYCKAFRPNWVTVPQLPVVDDTSRNRANRDLAKATAQWRSERGFNGRLILPLVFTHQEQLKGRTKWRNTLDTARKCYVDAGASGIWTVDSDLDDQKCRKAYRERFGALVDFHDELRATEPNATIISGPYWGMNLILWSKSLCDHPAISIGTGYRYMITGAFAKKAKKYHVALSPLRRWAIASPDLKKWLKDTSDIATFDDSSLVEFKTLHDNLNSCLRDRELAKEQVAQSYQEWFAKIQAAASAGRNLALYQDLSSACVLGSLLPILPKSEAPGRKAGQVAKELMSHCL